MPLTKSLELLSYHVFIIMHVNSISMAETVSGIWTRIEKIYNNILKINKYMNKWKKKYNNKCINKNTWID